MTSPGIELGISCGTDLATVYANLLSDAANSISISSNGAKTLVLMAGQIQSASFRQGAADGESIQQIQNNASLLADIGKYCQDNGIGVTVDAILTPPDAGGFYTNTGTVAVNGYVHAWATAAAVAGLPITSILDIQEVGTEDAIKINGITTANLAAIAGSEALAVNTLINIYRQTASDAASGSVQQLNADAALPQGQSFVTAAGLTLSDQRSLISNSYTNAVANLTVGDMEAGGGSFSETILQDVAQFWNDYDTVANSGTVELYDSWTNIGGQLTQSAAGLTTTNPATEIPNARTIWSQGTILDASALSQIINPGVMTQTGSVYNWTASDGTLPANWVSPAGTATTPLYEILQSGSVYTYVYEKSAVLSLNSAQKHFSFVTSDNGSGAAWQEWLQGLGTLASGGTIYDSGGTISIGSNPTLTLNVITEPYGLFISDTQVVQQAEHQAAMLARFGVPIANLINEVWTGLPLGTGPIYAPYSWTNAEAEITATYPLYMADLITAAGWSGVAVTTPGQLVVSVGTTALLGNLSLNYSAADSQQARLGIVVIDLNGTLSLTNGTLFSGSSSSGTFGGGGTFSGAGTNMLVLNGDTADLAQALRAIAVTEHCSGPDTVDIQTYGTNGQLSDSQINVYASIDAVTNLSSSGSDWAMSSATINHGTLSAEVLNWKTTVSPSSAVTAPSLFKTDTVLATLSDYDVSISSNDILNDGTSLVANPYHGHNDIITLPYFGGLNLVSQMASLIVQSTTNIFDAAGSLVQSIDVLVAPENVDGVDGSTLVQWGTQVTDYNVPGDGTPWTFGTQYSSAQLTINDNGQTIQALFLGGSSGSANTVYQIFNPNRPSEMWREIQTKTGLNGSLQAVVTEFNTGDNPFWDGSNWGTVAGSVVNEIWSNGGSICSGPGATIGTDGTSDVINLPNGGTVYGSPYATNIVNGNSVSVRMSNADTVTVTGDNAVVTGGRGSTVKLAGNFDVAGLYQGSTITASGHGEIIYGNTLCVIAVPGTSITINGTNDTVTLPGAAVTLNVCIGDQICIDATAAGVVANLDQLETLATSNRLASITLTSAGTPTLAVSAAQMTADAAAIALIKGPYKMSVTAPPGEVILSGPSSQYIIADNNGSLYVQDTVAGRDGTQVLPGVIEMVFRDGIGLFDPTGTAENVARLYGAALDRAPNVSGLEYWTAAIDDANVPLEAVASSFTQSPEFIQDYGSLSNAAFVNQIYENVLGRSADGDGAQYWNNLLASGASRGAVLLGFTQSTEYEAATLATAGDTHNAEVYRLYQAAFNRTPDAGGQAHWSSLLANGAAPTQIAQCFVDSAEFQQDYGALSIGDFVSTLYRNVLHRTGDSGGLQYWTSAIQQGASEASVLVGFSDSLENRIQTAGATHSNWVSELNEDSIPWVAVSTRKSTPVEPGKRPAKGRTRRRSRPVNSPP